MPVFSSGLEEKTTFANDDMLLLGDSDANDTTRKIKVGTLLAGGLNESLYKSIGAIPVKVEGEEVVAYEYENQLYSELEMAEIYTTLLKSTGGTVTPKFKSGDVVVCTNRADSGTFKLVTWEEYESDPSAYPDAVGLVVDPVKRTFVFCNLLNTTFGSIDDVKTYLASYLSFTDGQETFDRLVGIKGSMLVADFPAFYALRNGSSSINNSIFYQKNRTAYIPSLYEWEVAVEKLASAFYDDERVYASYLDRLKANRDGVTATPDYFFYDPKAMPVQRRFYTQVATVGLSGEGNLRFFDVNGSFGSSLSDCVVFGLYTEEEENNG